MAEQKPRGFNRVTIAVDVWCGEGAHATAWAVAENVRISMEEACRQIAEEISDEDAMISVEVQ